MERNAQTQKSARIPRPEELPPASLPQVPSLDERRAEELSYYLAAEIQLARSSGNFDSSGGELNVTLLLRNLDIEKESQIINHILAGSGWQGAVQGRKQPRSNGEPRPFDGAIKDAPLIILVISPRELTPDAEDDGTIPFA